MSLAATIQEVGQARERFTWQDVQAASGEPRQAIVNTLKVQARRGNVTRVGEGCYALGDLDLQGHALTVLQERPSATFRLAAVVRGMRAKGLPVDGRAVSDALHALAAKRRVISLGASFFRLPNDDDHATWAAEQDRLLAATGGWKKPVSRGI